MAKLVGSVESAIRFGGEVSGTLQFWKAFFPEMAATNEPEKISGEVIRKNFCANFNIDITQLS